MEDSLAVQTQAVEKLRALVGVLPADLLVAGSSDTALRRFLIARKWNVEVAAASIKKTIEWRRAHIPRLLATPIDERLTTLRTLIPGSPLLGFAKTGVPVSLLCPGAAPLDQVSKFLTTDDMISSLVLRAEWFSSEILALASKHAGHAIDREIACLDIGGIGVSALYIWLPLLRAYNTCATSHFPERTIHVLILNAGTTFSALWRVVKSIVDPRTAAKMRICSGGAPQLAVLREYCEDCIIPARYGGSAPEPSLSGGSAEHTNAVYARMNAWLLARQAAMSQTTQSSALLGEEEMPAFAS